MFLTAKVLVENFRQAYHAVVSNKLRSFLTLLGISVGIFCIVGVQAAVDSLEGEVRGSFDKLGNDVLYVQIFPWAEDPGQNYWKYMQRPVPSLANYEFVKENVQSAEMAALEISLGSKTIKYRNNNVERVRVNAVTEDYAELFALEFAKGRWYNPSEYARGANKIIIGHGVAEALFGAIEPVGRKVKFMGITAEIIGVIEEEGESLVQISNFDESVIVSYETAKKIANVKSRNGFGTVLAVKAKDGIATAQLKDELTGALRLSRKLRPREENNFAVNSISVIASALDSFFGSMNIASYIIGGFAIFVGMFSVANIMFVSVKERTNIIGIKKALGAKKSVILTEFLIEAVLLCILGGLVGLVLVFITLQILSNSMPYAVSLAPSNIIFGIGLSIVIGIIAGIIPAWQAASMDPVDAIRA